MKHLIIPLLIFCFFSCTEEITIHTDNSDPVIVIYGELTNNLDYQSVTVKRSSPYFDDEPNAGIPEAIVTISTSNAEVYELLENDTVPGLYQTTTKWAVQPGVTYSLKVEVDFNLDGQKEVYESSTSILSSTGIDSITVVPLNIMGHFNYSVNLYGYESPGEDFYLCKYLVNDSLISTKISKYQTLNDILFDGQYVDGLTLTYFGDISEKNTDSEEQQKNNTYLRSGDKVELQMSKISKGYFNFIVDCRREMRGSNPFFGGPPANITTNITNGGIGFFSGYCINKASKIVP